MTDWREHELLVLIEHHDRLAAEYEELLAMPPADPDLEAAFRPFITARKQRAKELSNELLDLREASGG